jgi:hypothetical protein
MTPCASTTKARARVHSAGVYAPIGSILRSVDLSSFSCLNALTRRIEGVGPAWARVAELLKR